MTGLVEEHIDPAALLAWHIAMGADEAIEADPLDRFAAPPPAPAAAPAQARTQQQMQRPQSPTSGPTPVAARPAQAMLGAGPDAAAKAASACNTLEELKAAMEAFDGGLLKKSAKHTVFADGTPGADLMVIGDLPSGEDDRDGIPFAGPAGMLLDKMLAAIGLNRTESAYLSVVVPWRPLGSNKPDPQILAVCKPFVERHIFLAKPKVVLALGGTLGKAVTGTQDSISRQRGKWRELSIDGQTFAMMASYHPTYLMTQPHQKGAAWRDLLAVQETLSS